MRLRHYTGQEIDMTLEELLEEINRDRNEDWLPFNQDDWLEGLDFTEYELLIEPTIDQLIAESKA